jgi:hypothetical protein
MATMLSGTRGPLFFESEFPAYEAFWLRHVVPLTNRPTDIQFKDDATLRALGKGSEDVAIAQLHYTVLKHLSWAHQTRRAGTLDDFALFVGLSALVGAHDVAFELLQRYTHRGQYDPWIESRPRGKQARTTKCGQDAQGDWKKSNGYPLQQIRDYRNKLVHGRTPPGIRNSSGMMLPAMGAVDSYCDWRTVTAPGAAARIPAGDFEPPAVLLGRAWHDTVCYLEQTWHQRLV